MKTAAKDAAAGLVLGGAGGTVGGEIAHIKRKKNLDELLDKRKDWGIAFTKQSGKPKEAIDKLLEQKQGFVPKAANKKGIGDIDFVWGKGKKNGYGVSHIIDQRNTEGLNGIDFVQKVPVIISDGYVDNVSTQPNIDFIRNGDDNVLVKKVWDNKKRNWMVTAFKNSESLNKSTNRTPDIVSSKNEMTPSFNLNKDNSIIPQSPQNLNPNLENISKKPRPFGDWLEELKRKRRLKG